MDLQRHRGLSRAFDWAGRGSLARLLWCAFAGSGGELRGVGLDLECGGIIVLGLRITTAYR